MSPAAASPVAAAPAAAAAAAVPADKPAVMKKLVSGFVEPMPPPGFVWSDVELDISGVVYPTAAAAAAEPKDEVAVDDAEAPIEGLSVAQACMFLAANPSVDAAEKKAFLASKGVSEFVIAQAECTASGMESTVHGHPGEGDDAEAPIEGLSVAQACMFFAANPSVDAAEKKAFLASKGVSEFVIAQAECTASGMESTVHGHPGEGDDAEAPIEGLSVAQACMFFAANPSVDAAEKKAFLASKGVSEFVIAQAECTASGMESTVHGHPGEGDDAEAPIEGLSVAQACMFFAANPSVDAAEKKAFLASKGVSEFVIAQAECTASGMESTVHGHPGEGDDAEAPIEGLSVAQACMFFAANPSVDAAEKKAFLASKGVSEFVIAQAECTASGMESTVHGHPGEGDEAETTEGWPLLGGINKWHPKAGPWPADAARVWLD